MKDLKKVFKIGSPVSIEIQDKKYLGALTQITMGEEVTIKLKKPDMTLFHLMSDTECRLLLAADDGFAYRFKSKLVRRKIPEITLAFPDSENYDTLPLRKLERVSTSIWASILVPKVEEGNTVLKEESDGTIVDLHREGCRLMSHYEVKVGESIILAFYYNDSDDVLHCSGEVRNMTPAPYEATYYGIAFKNLSEDARKKIDGIIDRPDD